MVSGICACLECHTHGSQLERFGFELLLPRACSKLNAAFASPAARAPRRDPVRVSRPSGSRGRHCTCVLARTSYVRLCVPPADHFTLLCCTPFLKKALCMEPPAWFCPMRPSKHFCELEISHNGKAIANERKEQNKKLARSQRAKQESRRSLTCRLERTSASCFHSFEMLLCTMQRVQHCRNACRMLYTCACLSMTMKSASDSKLVKSVRLATDSRIVKREREK